MKYLGLLLSVILVSCATTSEKIEQINRPLSELQKVADQNLPVGRAKVSPNGREFYSVPFIKEKGGFAKATDHQAHYVAVIKVLGDRRPYSISVEVSVQKRQSSGQFRKSGYDQGLARVISRRIQKSLHQRRDNRNIIDDFKVF